ncbi:hypothetical protein [Rhodopirellula sp. MGV]|uniref:hypothetical protein n=1 Tax=Rhodopirellula sp. MGV TaxID=2023130 RepID=UPI000B96B330|nr:hypothetical protein [Rhodopirellula sp. MGV]OYP28496.1 hypothetical protein CGZ80_27230 [Rhodopirellula sp. MGV]PNY38626.1 hypothetical protein C2E31_01540 [Rhodopirellula baltica]
MAKIENDWYDLNQDHDALIEAARIAVQQRALSNVVGPLQDAIAMSEIGDDSRKLPSGLIPGTWSQIAQNPRFFCNWLQELFPMTCSARFWKNWLAQKEAFCKLLRNFFSPEQHAWELGHIRIVSGRMCFANAVAHRYGGEDLPEGEPDVQVKGTIVDCLDDVINFQPKYLNVSVPLSRVKFRPKPQLHGRKKLSQVFAVGLDRDGFAGNHPLHTEQLAYGCDTINPKDLASGEFIQSLLEEAETDSLGRLLYVDTFDIVMTRYIPLHIGGGVTSNDIQQINWNLGKADGLTTGILAVRTAGPIPHVLIPGIAHELKRVASEADRHDCMISMS